MPTTPTTKRVKLKRVIALRAGDTIVPGLGLFNRDGSRMKRGSDVMQDAGPWGVTFAELDSSGMFVIELTRNGYSTLIWTPSSAYVVLALEGN